MKRSLATLLREPGTGQPLELSVFASTTDASGEETITEGMLSNMATGAAFPILSSVPVMFPGRFPRPFLEAHRAKLAEVPGVAQLRIRSDRVENFSFSTQWDQYFADDVERTWGYTVDERIEQLLMELQVDRASFDGKRVLDAGCGPGGMAEGIARLGADVVGLDYSSAVFTAEDRRDASNIQFMQSDLLSPGLAPNSFDVVISIGVLMCTPNTYEAFSQLCNLVNPHGRLYVWIYRRPETFFRRYMKYPAYDLARVITTRLPDLVQRTVVRSYAGLVKGVHKVRGLDSVPYKEYVASAYDDLTPRWRRYHTAYEMSEWFFRNGFGPPILSHWDNPYGFGMVATKEQQQETPGINYGDAPKLWDQQQTLVG